MLDGSDWLTIVGLGMAWLGWQIVVVGGWPHTLKATATGRPAERGTPEAFQRFWIEQYRIIGLGLGVGGLLMAVGGAVQ